MKRDEGTERSRISVREREKVKCSDGLMRGPVDASGQPSGVTGLVYSWA